MRRMPVIPMVTLVVAACGGGEVAVDTTVPSAVSVTPTTIEESTATTITDTSTTSTTAATTTTTWDASGWPADEGQAALAVIDEFYAAMNDGDPAAWMLVSSSSMRPDLAMLLDGVGGRFEHECSLRETAPEVVCLEAVRDDLYTPAGVSLQDRVVFEVMNAPRVVQKGLSCAVDDPSGDSVEFLLDLFGWTVATYPDLKPLWTGNLADGAPGIPCTPYPFRSVEAAQQVVALVPEFLDQSDRWPLPEAGSVEALAAWEAMATRVEALAALALVEIEVLREAVAYVSSDEMAADDWFDTCCAEPRDAVLDLFEQIDSELTLAVRLAGRLDPGSNAHEHMVTARSELRFGIQLLEVSIQKERNRGMVNPGLPTILEYSVLGCLHACVAPDADE